jgi:hypothetical protein
MNNLLSSLLFSVNNVMKTNQLIEQKKKNEELSKIPKSLEDKEIKINTHIHKKDKLNYKINTKSQEYRIRKLMENFFGVPFDKCRPAFLKNEATGRNLELDLYNQHLNIAFEIQGQQHISYLPHFHKSYADFENQKFRDHLKYKKCKEHNVKLVIIYYYEISEQLMDTELLQMILTKLNELS